MRFLGGGEKCFPKPRRYSFSHCLSCGIPFLSQTETICSKEGEGIKTQSGVGVVAVGSGALQRSPDSLPPLQ